MISFTRSGVTFLEYYLDEPFSPDDQPFKADVVRAFYRSQPASTYRYEETYTLFLDLDRPENALLGEMDRVTRSQIRRAEEHDALSIEVIDSGSSRSDDVQAFCDFYDSFASLKGLRPLYRERLYRFAEASHLALARAVGADGNTLVWHGVIETPGRVHVLHSPSVLPSVTDRDTRNLIGRANRLLHWMDIRRYRLAGVRIYDFGGYATGTRDTGLAGVNRFKADFGGQIVPVYTTQIPRSFRGLVAIALARRR